MTNLTLLEAAFTENGLQAISKLPKLENIRFNETNLDDKGVKILSSIKSLRVIDLYKCKNVTNRSMEYLGKCSEVIQLVLNFTQVDDAGLAHCSSLPKLECLSAQGPGITDMSLIALESCKALKMVEFLDTKISDAGISRFRKALPKAELIPHRLPD